jgi:hypothetical protein
MRASIWTLAAAAWVAVMCAADEALPAGSGT